MPVIAVAGRSVLSDIQLRNAGIAWYTLADLEPEIPQIDRECGNGWRPDGTHDRGSVDRLRHHET